jgi:hypothetical protein
MAAFGQPVTAEVSPETPTSDGSKVGVQTIPANQGPYSNCREKRAQFNRNITDAARLLPQ